MKANITPYTGSGGRIGHNVLAKVQGTYNFRRYRVKRQPPSGLQQAYTGTVSLLANVWENELTGEAKAAWNSWAATHVWEWGLPPNPRMTGLNWWTRGTWMKQIKFNSQDPTIFPGSPQWGAMPVITDEGGSFFDSGLTSGLQAFWINISITPDFPSFFNTAYVGFRSPKFGPKWPQGPFSKRTYTDIIPTSISWTSGLPTLWEFENSFPVTEPLGGPIVIEMLVAINNNLSYPLVMTLPVVN